MEIIQYLLAGNVGEIYVAEGDYALGILHVVVTALVFGFLVHDGENTLGASDGSLDLAVQLGDLIDGTA